MSWKGIAIGGCLGAFWGGPFGALFGAALGHQLEKAWSGKEAPRRRRPMADGDRTLVFLASVSAMLAKMAKADGRVTADEIAAVERAFARLGFDATARRYAIGVFRQAKDDAHTIYDYAREFAAAVSSVEVRELFYAILWDLARADGRVSDAERRILREMPAWLGIRAGWYAAFDAPQDSADDLAGAYATLGVSARASDADVRKAYRDKAKKCHPDVLKAQGLPDELVGKATEQMKKINAAWATIKAARDL